MLVDDFQSKCVWGSHATASGIVHKYLAFLARSSVTTFAGLTASRGNDIRVLFLKSITAGYLLGIVAHTRIRNVSIPTKQSFYSQVFEAGTPTTIPNIHPLPSLSHR